MVLEFKKTGKVYGQASGRGPDNVHFPGAYTILLNGTEMGRIIGHPRRYMDSGSWEIIERYDYDRTGPRWPIGRSLFPTLKEAKRQVIRQLIRGPVKRTA